MKYPLQHKIFAVVLALMVLCSTLSFTVEKHYCGGELVAVSLFAELEKCGMDSAVVFESSPCCKDEIAVVEGQDELQLSVSKLLKFHKSYFVPNANIARLRPIETQIQPRPCFHAHAPPESSPNIQIRDQVFLI